MRVLTRIAIPGVCAPCCCLCVLTCCCVQAYHGHCSALEVLLGSLLEVDVRTPEGRTPLTLASCRGHSECVSLLLHHGASPVARDYAQKRTAIHAAGESGG